MYRLVQKTRYILFLHLLLGCSSVSEKVTVSGQDNIPLPEHPRPDFQRENWLNLNGPWSFGFDGQDIGLKQEWFKVGTDFPLTITVPFPWGSKLSGVVDEGDIAWYARLIEVDKSWERKRVFVVFGACDWNSRAWLDGNFLGEHSGGYTPFEFELTPHIKTGELQYLVLRVDDTPHDFKLEGKQGYGRAAGIWQTVYLEARPQVALKTVHFTPDIDKELVSIRVTLDQPAPENQTFLLEFKSIDLTNRMINQRIPKGSQMIQFDVSIEQPHLWSLEDPYLYEVDAVLRGSSDDEDRISTYFGMRKIGVVNLPGTDFSYIALNNKPVYIQSTLDQAYHPDGYYTFPSDEFMRNEILRTRQIGLNSQRIHVKIGIPRKLYWADRLGVLIMADIPNSWGEPGDEMRHEIEVALRGMIDRDYNHPSIFSWVTFNETWGLRTKSSDENEGRKYLPETQEWVTSIYHLAKELDPSRLVEDNSPNRRDHVITDINSWHAYLPGYRWRERLDEITQNTYPGSEWNFIGGRTQGNQPMFNSECGNVWGYEGSTGDVDWSWDYHIMINEFRRHPKVCGWLYTEHHDVINEWNGYYRFDRSKKYTGLSELVPGMRLNDLHGQFYVATERELCRKVKPGSTIEVPLYVSFMTDQMVGDELVLHAQLYGWDNMGRRELFTSVERRIPFSPWKSEELRPLKVKMPDQSVLAILSLVLEDRAGSVLHRNFTSYLVSDDLSPREERTTEDNKQIRVIRFAPNTYRDAKWSKKSWEVLDGLKVNGAGSGFFEYRLNWPKELDVKAIGEATFKVEVSAKQLFGKDMEDAGRQEGNFMLGKGTHDSSLNPNSYPMTDEELFPSAVRVRIADQGVGMFDLKDDPADHRGILSWYSQKQDRRLREAGSYGYLITARIPAGVLEQAAARGEIVVRLEVDDAFPGGLAIYGERFGRYPLDPTLTFILKD